MERKEAYIEFENKKELPPNVRKVLEIAFLEYPEFKKIKKGAWIINVSRGGVIDESELYKALKKGHLSGAALDVFEQEPYAGPLKELDNVILTPHIGSYAKEGRINMEIEAVKNVLNGAGIFVK